MSYPTEYKIFQDPIHGCIELHPLCVKIIDTPQFQRLRCIKQLGLVYFVYPGASHNRFEHSIGTCHLASLLVKNLQQRQPELNITQKDVLCVEIAGLCHDLGHGPFSHTFDQKFLPHIHKKSGQKHGKKTEWEHEDGSVDMFEHLYNENKKVSDGFIEEELTEIDKTFIKNLIKPKDELKNNEGKTGRGKDKEFLYEIIANKKTGIDVDKWDYFARDCHHLGIKNNFDHQRLMKFVRVMKMQNNEEKDSSGQQSYSYRLSYRDKVAETIYNMFHLRRIIHKNACQHKIVNCISEMFTQALVQADEHITRIGSDGKKWSMSKSIGDMKAYSQFTDNIFEEILYSTSKELEDSRVLLQKIICRELYQFIGFVPFPTDRISSLPREEIIKRIAGEDQDLAKQLMICVASLDYGSKTNNPVDKVPFYSKSSANEVKYLSSNMISHMLPKTFSERIVQVFLKDNSLEVKAKENFRKWKESILNESPESSIH